MLLCFGLLESQPGAIVKGGPGHQGAVLGHATPASRTIPPSLPPTLLPHPLPFLPGPRPLHSPRACLKLSTACCAAWMYCGVTAAWNFFSRRIQCSTCGQRAPQAQHEHVHAPPVEGQVLAGLRGGLCEGVCEGGWRGWGGPPRAATDCSHMRAGGTPRSPSGVARPAPGPHRVNASPADLQAAPPLHQRTAPQNPTRATCREDLPTQASANHPSSAQVPHHRQPIYNTNLRCRFSFSC